MRRSTKTLIALIGTAVMALGVVVNFTSVQEVKASPSYGTYKALETAPFTGPTASELGQMRLTEQAAADREALVTEGLKPENHHVVFSDGSSQGSGLIGLYYLDDVKGIAYHPAIADTKGTEVQKSYCIAYETDEKQSPAAIATANEIAKSVNAVVGPSVNFEYNKVEGDVVTKNSEAAEGTMSMGLDPSFAGEGDKVAVIAIYPGGTTRILEDTDDDPATVTVDVPATDSSLVMYSIIKYN